MKFPEPISVIEIASKYNAKILGNSQALATGINEIHKVGPGDITFVDIEKYFKKSLSSAASIILLNKETECPEGKTLLIVDDPFEVYDAIVKSYRPYAPLTETISSSAVIHPSTILEPNVVIGPHVRIGKNCHIQANVTIAEHTIIGNGVLIQSGTVIGTDAFYFKKKENQYKKWRSGGRVVIHDNVDIGAACTINKGVSGDTIIGRGTKIDCQVHIGHGVEVGEDCLFAAQVGIGGKAIIEDRVTLYGQVGIINGIRIGAGAVVLSGSGVSKDLPGGKTYFGAPVVEARERMKELVALKKLPELLKKLDKK